MEYEDLLFASWIPMSHEIQTTPSVSVTIATYNRAGMVREAIEAAQRQTLAPLEIIVTDDASTDETWTMLQELAEADPRVKPYLQPSNTGGVENWNTAVRQAQGKYIAWCSDDDRFLPDHLESAVTFLEQNPGAGFTHAGFVDALETDQGSERCPRPLRFGAVRVIDRGDLLAYMTRYYDWPFHPSTIVMRREVFERVGPFDAAYALADTDWFVRAVEQFPAAMLPRHSVLNRRHPGNWSNRVGSAKMQDEIFEIVEGAIGRIEAGALARAGWRAVWRANVRARLLLTLRARIREGYGDAAAAVFGQLLRGTGHKAPLWFTEAGERLVRGMAGGREPKQRSGEIRQTVRPL